VQCGKPFSSIERFSATIFLPAGIIFSNQDVPVAIFLPSKTTRAIKLKANAV
jgi:hypothetical protein